MIHYEVRSIDPIRESEGGWNWNESYVVGSIDISEDASNDELISAMIDNGYFREGVNRNDIHVEEFGERDIEFQDSENDYMPLYALQEED